MSEEEREQIEKELKVEPYKERTFEIPTMNEIMRNPILSPVAKLRTSQKSFERNMGFEMDKNQRLVNDLNQEFKNTYLRKLKITSLTFDITQNFINLFFTMKQEIDLYEETLNEILETIGKNYQYSGLTREQQGLDEQPLKVDTVTHYMQKQKGIPPDDEERGKQRKILEEIAELRKETDATAKEGIALNKYLDKAGDNYEQNRSYLSNYLKTWWMTLKRAKEPRKKEISVLNKVLGILKKHGYCENLNFLRILQDGNDQGREKKK